MDTFLVLTGPLAALDDHDDPAHGVRTWRLLAATGEEEVSKLTSFSLSLDVPRSRVESLLPAADIESIERALLRAQVEFRIGTQGLTRFGIVSAVHDEGEVEVAGVPLVRLRVEVSPRASLLLHRKNTRIFQGRYVHQIVSKVMSDAGVAHRWNLANTYPKRIYCTQYDETDYEFVTRLLAEEGILFFFEHTRAFAGGPVPELPGAAKSDWDKAADVLGGIGKGLSTVGELIGVEAVKTAGTVASIAADFSKTPPKDEEADDPIAIGAGTAGPGGDGDVLVFIDRPTAYPESSHDAGVSSILTITLRDPSNLSDSVHEIVEIAPTQRIRPDHVEMRDYDFRRPMLVLESRAATGGDANVPLEMYDHHSEYEKPEITAQLAQVELEQHRREVIALGGQGPCTRFLPGHVFGLRREVGGREVVQRFAITSVRHEAVERGLASVASDETEALLRGIARAIATAASAGGALSEAEIRSLLRRSVLSSPGSDRTYWTHFECVPADFAKRPPRPVREPRHVTEVAVVVGKPEQDIYTDKYGRIKIQFNWDREGKWNENSSCWVRVVQPWAGTGFGFQFIPRTGMEVLVTFLSGDPDRPVVLGSLYNATHATPEPLPQRSTRSGIRSQTTPNGGGFNELSFEDQAGVERIHLHAQKDLHEIVNDTHTANVKNKQVLNVGNLMEVGVGGDQRWAVGGNRSDLVGKDAFERVAGNLTSDVIANRTDRVHGSALTTVAGMALREVKTDDSAVVEGSYNLSVHGDLITHVGGRNHNGKGSAVTYVQGSSFLTATDRVLLKAENAEGDGSSSTIRFECGESFIEIGPERITLRAQTIELRAEETVSLRGESSTVTLSADGAAVSANPIELRTPDGSELVLDAGSATLTGPSGSVVQGSTVSLRSGQAQGETDDDDDEDEDHEPNLKLIFSHLRQTEGGSRIANTRYRIVAEDQVLEGTTDGQGKVQVWVPDTVRVAYVVLWANEQYSDIYPSEEGPLHWLIRIERELPAATAIKGARIRLRNLGYDPGTKLDEESVDPPTRSAILEFQMDQDLPATGELDEATTQKITNIYGS